MWRRLVFLFLVGTVLCPSVSSANQALFIGCQGGNPPAGGPCGKPFQDDDARLQLKLESQRPGDSHFNVRWRQRNGNEVQFELRQDFHDFGVIFPLVDYTVKVQLCTHGAQPLPTDTCGPWSEQTIMGGWLGVVVRLESVNSPGRFIRHQNLLASTTTIPTELDQRDSLLLIRCGLADENAVSFESVNFRSSFLRHQNARVRIPDVQDGDFDLNKKDAPCSAKTFLARSIPTVRMAMTSP